MNAKIRKARRDAARAAPHNLPTVSRGGRVLGPESFRAEFFKRDAEAVYVNGRREYRTRQVALFDAGAVDADGNRDADAVVADFVDYYRDWARAHRKPLVSPKGNATTPNTGVGDGFRARPALKVEKEWLGRTVAPTNGLQRAVIVDADGKLHRYVDARGDDFRGQVVAAAPGGLWVYVTGVGFWKAHTDDVRDVATAEEVTA